MERVIYNGYKNGYLCDIYLRQIESQEIDLRRCHVKEDGTIGETDFQQSELVKALANSAPFIKQVYDEYAFGQTLIYVAGVPLARRVAEIIPNCMAISGDMDLHDREAILQEFMRGRVPCLVSVDALKEGVDLPNVQTLIYCRPTLSSLLYTQIVGRGLRTYDNGTYEPVQGDLSGVHNCAERESHKAAAQVCQGDQGAESGALGSKGEREGTEEERKAT